MPRRVEKKESELPGLIKFKKVFSKPSFPVWAWATGTVAGVCIISLFPFSAPLHQKAGITIIVSIFVVILFICIFRFYREFLDKKYLALSTILFLASLFISKLIMVLPQIPDIFIPVAFLSILFSLFFNFPVSLLFLGIFCSFLVLFSGGWELLPIWLAGGIIGAYGAPFIHQRADITRVGLWVGLANLSSAIGVGLFKNSAIPDVAVWGIWAMGSGIFSSVLVNAVLPYLETYLGITTDIRLLELTDLNHPLLRRLSIEAPGTYHHTVMVATLAVSAAEVVGANPLLTRVGAYYHDIGKIIRPHFFFENSRMEGRIDDYHSHISPNLSSMVIISHVKDGIELARIYRLPQQVIDIIAQHHGTSLIAYFYRKALLKKGKEKSVDESSFRYPGPKPKTKEAAIVMLADSVEADSRFSVGKSHKEIVSQIRKVINNKLQDHQLDEVDLTLRDLTRISEAFTRVLAGLSHTRGRYPEEVLKEVLKGEEKIGQHQQFVGEKGSQTGS